MSQFQKVENNNVAMATAGTEYSLSVPNKTRKISIRSRLQGELKWGLSAGAIAAGNYVTIPPNGSVFFENVYFKAQTWYFTSDQNSDVLEVQTLQDTH